VIREAVTNVLRHSTATHVEIQYAAGVVAIRNDGAEPGAAERMTSGTGLAGLAEQLGPSGGSLTTSRDGDQFVVRVQLAEVAAPSGAHLGAQSGAQSGVET
jgi:two-component system, NarL family, sensor histidine kinase DesK